MYPAQPSFIQYKQLFTYAAVFTISTYVKNVIWMILVV